MSTRKEDGLSINISLSPEEKLEKAGTYTGLIRDAIDQAIKREASDIHFEPTSEGYKIRLRICGSLRAFYDFENTKSISIKPDILKSGIITTLKSITNISLGKQNIDQDSGINLPKRGISIRVNKMPTIFGEKFVFRLFDKNQPNDLSKIGLDSSSYSDVLQAIRKKSGLIIITGETGSGKTSTIYSMIEKIDRTSLNVATLENPVERNLVGVNHTAVTEAFGFADGLRALMRQDPDVIVIGEIRDETTAKLAVRASSTGHLVISTMHTNTALNIPKVFEYYGADRLQLMESLIMGVNQRLIKRICQKCSVKGNVGRRVNLKGCKECNGGYQNKRELIFEYFTANQIEGNKINLKRETSRIVEELVLKGVIDENELHRQSNVFSASNSFSKAS